MNLSQIASLVFVIALAAVPQLVIYFATRENDSSVEPGYGHEMR